jgi:hypothetical protein
MEKKQRREVEGGKREEKKIVVGHHRVAPALYPLIEKLRNEVKTIAQPDEVREAVNHCRIVTSLQEFIQTRNIDEQSILTLHADLMAGLLTDPDQRLQENTEKSISKFMAHQFSALPFSRYLSV